jgi:site-specific recombinase XerD
MAKQNFNGYKYHRKLITYKLEGETQSQTKRIYGKTIELLEAKETELWNWVALENQRRKAAINVLTSVGHHFPIWLARYKQSKKKVSTYINYELFMNNWIIPNLGQLQLAEVTSDHIQDLMNAMINKGRKLQTQKHVYILLMSFFTWAYNRRLIKDNPMITIEKPITEKPNPNPPSKEEVEAILKDTKDNSATINYLFFAIAAKTGMRRSEVAGLSVENYDAKKRILFVRRAVIDVTRCGEKQSYQIFDKLKTTCQCRYDFA